MDGNQAPLQSGETPETECQYPEGLLQRILVPRSQRFRRLKLSGAAQPDQRECAVIERGVYGGRSHLQLVESFRIQIARHSARFSGKKREEVKSNFCLTMAI